MKIYNTDTCHKSLNGYHYKTFSFSTTQVEIYNRRGTVPVLTVYRRGTGGILAEYWRNTGIVLAQYRRSPDTSYFASTAPVRDEYRTFPLGSGRLNEIFGVKKKNNFNLSISR